MAQWHTTTTAVPRPTTRGLQHTTTHGSTTGVAPYSVGLHTGPLAGRRRARPSLCPLEAGILFNTHTQPRRQLEGFLHKQHQALGLGQSPVVCLLRSGLVDLFP